ncbi:hypothetical protein H0H93_001539, partial [Arthromyces matolae]
MLGTFTSIYKFLLNALPLLIPAVSLPQRRVIRATEEPSETPFLSDADEEEEEGPTAEHPTTMLRVPLKKR